MIATITTLLGWASVINIIFLMVTAILLLLLHKPTLRIHSKLFRLEEEFLNKAYFQFLAQYKIAIIMFNITPYIALKII